MLMEHKVDNANAAQRKPTHETHEVNLEDNWWT